MQSFKDADPWLVHLITQNRCTVVVFWVELVGCSTLFRSAEVALSFDTFRFHEKNVKLGAPLQKISLWSCSFLSRSTAPKYVLLKLMSRTECTQSESLIVIAGFGKEPYMLRWEVPCHNFPPTFGRHHFGGWGALESDVFAPKRTKFSKEREQL